MRTIVRIAALITITATFTGAAVGTASAADLNAAQRAILISGSDIPGASAHHAKFFTNGIGSVIPTTCFSLLGGPSPEGNETKFSTFSEVRFPDNSVWQSSVHSYASASAAQLSFTRLRDASLSICNQHLTGLIGDDVPDMMAVQVTKARRLPAASGFARFSNASSTILLDPATARPGYHSTYNYQVFALAGDAIVAINYFGYRPLSNGKRALAQGLAVHVADRYVVSKGK